MSTFLVRNSRPRKPITLDGRVLRAGRPSKDQVPGEMWISEELFYGPQVTKLLRLQRLSVVDSEGVSMDAVQEYLDGVVFETQAPPEEAPVEEVREALTLEEEAPEAPTLEEEVLEEEDLEEEVLVEELDDPTGPDTVEELEDMKYHQLKSLAADLGLSASGKKADLVERIYEYQHPSEDS